MTTRNQSEELSSGFSGTERVEVAESYERYEPPMDFGVVVRQLLESVPSKYLIGLRQVRLRDSASLTRREWSGKKRMEGLLAGRYYRRTTGSPASIDLFVDNILSEWPGWVLRVPLARDLAIGMTLFHEVGHHVHAATRPEYKEAETAAEGWARKLMRKHTHRCYRFQQPLVFTLAKLAALFDKERT